MTVYFIISRAPKEINQKIEEQKEETQTLQNISEIQKPTAINPISRPLEKKPELNPIEKTNPFKDVYKNPFE